MTSYFASNVCYMMSFNVTQGNTMYFQLYFNYNITIISTLFYPEFFVIIHKICNIKLICRSVYYYFSGYLTEKSLFYYNPLLPHLTRRLNDDLSHFPTPYKLMRSMLMSPGSLSGYTFYRVRPESQETGKLYSAC